MDCLKLWNSWCDARLNSVFRDTQVGFQIYSADECDWIRYSNQNNQAGTFGPFYWQLAGSNGCTEFEMEDANADSLLR